MWFAGILAHLLFLPPLLLPFGVLLFGAAHQGRWFHPRLFGLASIAVLLPPSFMLWRDEVQPSILVTFALSLSWPSTVVALLWPKVPNAFERGHRTGGALLCSLVAVGYWWWLAFMVLVVMMLLREAIFGVLGAVFLVVQGVALQRLGTEGLQRLRSSTTLHLRTKSKKRSFVAAARLLSGIFWGAAAGCAWFMMFEPYRLQNFAFAASAVPLSAAAVASWWGALREWRGEGRGGAIGF